jgi:hypothetical protein
MSSNTAAKITLKELMKDLIPKSKYPLAAVFESITNSLESISGHQVVGKIKISLFFRGIFEGGKELERIEIEDNGVGFNSKNFERFELLLDKSKGFNNRGSGRIQYLHMANRVFVESNYFEQGKIFHRSFFCDPINFISRPKNIEIENSEWLGAKVTFMELDFSEPEKIFFDNLELKSLKNEIKSKFLLRLYLDKKKENNALPNIEIVFFKNGEILEKDSISFEDIPEAMDSGTLEVSYSKIDFIDEEEFEWKPIIDKKEVLNWAHFKIPQSELDQNNVYLCSKNVAVESISLKQIKKNDSIEGFRFLTAIYGDIFDNENYVSHSVDSFKFPKKDVVNSIAKGNIFFDKNKEYLFQDDIEESVQQVIEKVYQDVSSINERKKQNAMEIAKAHGFSVSLVPSIKISISDTEEQITDKLYKKHAEILSRNNRKIKSLYESLNQLNPTEENYQNNLEEKSTELLTLIPQQNKEELSRYVIRREMVTNVLKLILGNKLEYQLSSDNILNSTKKDHEGLIHNLIFKKKEQTTAALNDLWILNEEFVHFEGCSELPISQIEIPKYGKLIRSISDVEINSFGLKPNRRPDIFLFPEEGKCVLIELKEPRADLSDHLNQTIKYANLIANFSNIKIDTFYCYLIGENISQIDIPGDFDKSISNDWVRKIPLSIRSVLPENEGQDIAKAQVEIIKLSSIHERAHRRNKSFADRLGIRIEE